MADWCIGLAGDRGKYKVRRTKEERAANKESVVGSWLVPINADSPLDT